MLDQHVGGAEAFLVFEVVGNDRFAGPQGKSRRRFHVCSEADNTDDAGIPADAGLHQEAVFLRDIA